MASTRRRSASLFWAVLLLVLAASPLTAPFSSCSLLALLSDHELEGIALLQAKSAKDDTTSTPTRTAVAPFSAFVADAALHRDELSAFRHGLLQIPLRI